MKKMKEKPTKICLVKNCLYSKGTREGVKMFRAPKDLNENEKWQRALNVNVMLNGMICIQYFKESDLKPATKTRPVALQPGAVPTIIHQQSETPEKKDVFYNEDEENVDAVITIAQTTATNTVASTIETVETTCRSCEILKTENEELRRSHLNLITSHNVEVAKFESKIKKMENQLTELRQSKKIDRMKSKYNQDSKNKMKETLTRMRKEKLLNQEVVNFVEKLDQNGILSCLVNGVKIGEKYPESVRQLCLSMHYHSPRAYEFFRTSFNKKLPHSSTIAAWYRNSNISGEPGLNDDTLQRLKMINEDNCRKGGKSLVCAILFDEMYIRRQIHWCQQSQKYFGYVTYPEQVQEKVELETSSYPPKAKMALVFMLRGVNQHFEFPLSYYFIDSLKSDQRVELLKDIIEKVTSCGIRVSNLTFDGYSANFKMCKMLGADLNVDSNTFKHYFINPADNENHVYILPDPCHMEKLARNTLANIGVIYNAKNEKIEWKYFVELERLKREEDFKTHKLSKKHIQWKRTIMNVRYAVETFSTKVADSMEFLMKNGYEYFADVKATIEFVRKMDTLFDILNSKYRPNQSIFKRPLNSDNKRVVFDFFHECADYFKTLQIRNTSNKMVRLVASKNQTSFKGFIICMASICSMYEELVEKDKLTKSISVYSINQDHLEIFFGKIRSLNGHNDNPNVVQFRSAFRKLLCNTKIMAPENSNCQQFERFENNSPFTNIYFVSSRRSKLNVLEDIEFQEELSGQRNEIIENLIELDEKNYDSIDGCTGASIAFAAQLIEEKIRNTDKFYCALCQTVFDENEKLENCFLSSKIRNAPCVSTYKICEVVNKFVIIHQKDRIARNNFKIKYYMIFQELDYEDMFSSSDFRHHPDDKLHLIKCIVNEYVKIRSTQLANDITDKEIQKVLRKKLTKMIHFKGQ